MIERIVVPLDGSLTAEAVLPQVRRLLYRKDSEILLVRAVPVAMVPEATQVAEAQLGAAQEYILGQKERLEREGVRVRHLIRVGAPVRVILDIVEEEKATLVALATHGATGLSRLLFGSVAEAVIRECPVPVLLVRPFWSYEMAPAGRPELRPIRNLLLPVDGSGLARQALPGIIELAELFETRVVLLRILRAENGVVHGPDHAAARSELEELAKELEKNGVETLRLLGTGDPVERILKTVRDENIDLLAMATHGRTGWSRIKEGSITEQVLRKAEVPLLVTRVPMLKELAGTPVAARSRPS
jgi:nucleotide-binding universal stress UspA family protein